MQALLFDGAPAGDSFAGRVRGIFMEELVGAGWKVEAIALHEKKIAFCRGCFGCWIKIPGICVIDDFAREAARRIVQNDLVIYLSPITFGGFSAPLKRVMDRSIGNVLPFFMKYAGEVHHIPRYERFPDFISAGLLPAPDEEASAIFEALHHRNRLNDQGRNRGALILTAAESDEAVRARVRPLLAEGGAVSHAG